MLRKYITKAFVPATLVAMAGVVSSCDDMLDTKPQGVFSAEQLDEESIDGVIAAAYEGLEAHYWGDNNNPAFAGPSTNWIFDVRSDDAYKGGGAISMEGNIHQLEIGNIYSDNASCYNKWENNYYAIARCNKAILAIEEAGLANSATLKAEIKALRAYFYFDLIRVFEAIPYFTENDDPSTTSAYEFSRDQIFSFIKADLADAVTVLPATSSKPGRINKYVAAAIHAKVSAFTSSWTELSQYCDVVMAGPYQLYNNYGDMSKVEFNNTYESILAMQCNDQDTRFHLNWCNLLNTTYSAGNLYGGGDDFFLGSQNLVNAFRTDSKGLPYLDNFNDVKVTTNYSGTVDPRLDFTVGRIGMPWRGYEYTKQWCRAYDLYGEYSGKKGLVEPGFSAEMVQMPWGQVALNFNFIRYADIVLLKAEALIELNQDLDLARQLINSVRQKAARSIDPSYRPVDLNPNVANYNVGEYPAGSSWTQDYARKAVRMERRLELAMEGHRWFDLVRWGVAVQVINKYYTEETAVRSYYADANLSEDELFFPIPLVEQENAGDLYRKHISE